MIVEVKNNGTSSDSSKLKICDANNTTKEFTSSDTGTIDVGSTKIFKIKVEKDWADANGRIAMLIKVDETEDEIYTYNNFSYEYATLNYGQYTIAYVLNGGNNNSKNPYTYLTTDTISLAKPRLVRIIHLSAGIQALDLKRVHSWFRSMQVRPVILRCMQNGMRKIRRKRQRIHQMVKKQRLLRNQAR